MLLKQKTSPEVYISDFQIIVTREKRHYLKTKQITIYTHFFITIYRQTIAKTETLTLYSCVTIIDKLTGQNIACKQALQLGESREVTRKQHAKEDANTKRALATISNKFSFLPRKPQETAKR